MGKYFTPINEDCNVEDIDAVIFIRGHCSSYGTLNCNNETLETLWREYSNECWAAGFMIPNEQLVQSFTDWLTEKEDDL